MTDKTILLRRIICTAVSFILSICLFAFAVCSAAGIVCTTKYNEWLEDKSSYSELSFESLKTELSDLTIPSGLPIDFFDTRLDKELYTSRVKESFASYSSGLASTFTLEEINAEFYALAYDYALTQNRVISDEAKEALNGFAKECTERYMKYANPSVVKTILSALPRLRKPLLVADISIFLLSLASFFLMYYLCRKKDLAKHVFFSFSGAALMSGVIPLILLISKEVQKISLSSPALHSLASNFIEGILVILILFAVIYLLVSILTLTFKFIHNKKDSN